MNSLSSYQNSSDGTLGLKRWQLRKLCRSVGQHALLGSILDYSEESLAALDKLIEDKWPEPPAGLQEMTVFFGAYVGETIHRRLKWRWTRSAGSDWHLAFVTEDRAELFAFPFAKMRKRFVNGQTDSLAAYFSVLKQVSQGKG